jgi:hypothetical protein
MLTRRTVFTCAHGAPTGLLYVLVADLPDEELAKIESLFR